MIGGLKSISKITFDKTNPIPKLFFITQLKAPIKIYNYF